MAFLALNKIPSSAVGPLPAKLVCVASRQMKNRAAIAALVAALSAITSAKELPVDLVLKAQLYDNGVRHEQIMQLKNVTTLLTSGRLLPTTSPPHGLLTFHA